MSWASANLVLQDDTWLAKRLHNVTVEEWYAGLIGRNFVDFENKKKNV